MAICAVFVGAGCIEATAKADKKSIKPAAKKAPAKTVTKKTATKAPVKKTEVVKSNTTKTVQKQVAKKKNVADIYNTNVSILLAMAIEAMILFGNK